MKALVVMKCALLIFCIYKVSNTELKMSEINLPLLYPCVCQCEEGRALNAMYHALYNPPTKIMILGPGCSNAAVPLSLALREWNLTMVENNSSSFLFRIMQ